MKMGEKKKKLDSESQPKSAPGQYPLATVSSKHHHFCYYFLGCGDKVGREQERKREKARVPWVECVREVGLNIYKK